MMEGNICVHCEKDLRLVKTIHVVKGQHFCTKDCAIIHMTNEIIQSAKEQAIEAYNEYAEEVTPMDIGLVYEKKWTAYSSSHDVTTIFLSRYLDAECNEAVSTEVIGFYWGEPNDDDTQNYTGELKAEY